MRTRWWSYQLDELNYYRFSLYHFGRNMQTVYMYHFGDVLIDSAQSNSDKNVRTALLDKSIDTILVTHHHEDHSGNLAWLKDENDALVYAHPKAAKKLTRGFTVSPLGRLISGKVDKVKTLAIEDGQRIEAGPFQIIAVHTPGHTDDHMAYHVPERGWLFSGDMYVADKIKYFESSEDISLQIESLKKMTLLDFDALLCSHNPKTHDGKKRLLRKLDLMENFYGEVMKLHDKGMSANDILKAMGRKENHFFKIMTVGHFTAVNMVKSVLRSEGIKG